MKKKNPLRFKKSQNIRIIIDYTEFSVHSLEAFIDRAIYTRATQVTQPSDLSKAFECSISDREITIQSGLPYLLAGGSD